MRRDSAWCTGREHQRTCQSGRNSSYRTVADLCRPGSVQEHDHVGIARLSATTPSVVMGSTWHQDLHLTDARSDQPIHNSRWPPTSTGAVACDLRRAVAPKTADLTDGPPSALPAGRHEHVIATRNDSRIVEVAVAFGALVELARPGTVNAHDMADRLTPRRGTAAPAGARADESEIHLVNNPTLHC